MTCPNCGAEIKDNRRFCGKCGTEISPAATAPAAPGRAAELVGCARHVGHTGPAGPAAGSAPASPRGARSVRAARPLRPTAIRPAGPATRLPAARLSAAGLSTSRLPAAWISTGGVPTRRVARLRPSARTVHQRLRDRQPRHRHHRLDPVRSRVGAGDHLRVHRRDQIRRSQGREQGTGMATAGIVIGFVALAIWLTFFVVGLAASGSNG